MSKKVGIWAVVLFILNPLAYYLIMVEKVIIDKGGYFVNYLILIMSCIFIIITNILLLKEVSKKK